MNTHSPNLEFLAIAAQRDLTRIADALEKLTTFDFKRVGDVAIGKFAEPMIAVSDPQNPEQAIPAPEPPLDQIQRLASYIITKFPGEPSQNQGAIDTAIRLLDKYIAPDDDTVTLDDFRKIADALSSVPDFRAPGESVGAAVIRLLRELKDRRAIPVPAHQPGSAEDFAAFLTVQPEEIKAGAMNTTYAVFDAVKKYRERIDKDNNAG